MVDQVDEVKSKVDIIEIISSYLPLRKAGRNFAALCPFHSEKTPSFMVSPERQVFKCFGCGEAGDVFTFLEKMEGWDFKETLEELAKRAGVKLSYTAGFGKTKIKDKLVGINTLVAKFYAHVLNKHPLGEAARRYLAKRGIKKNIWEKFGLGYAPSGWENALSFLTKRGLALEDVATAGLVVARDAGRQSYYDRFRERLIFPLKDARGSILGFSARVIEPPFAQVFDPEVLDSEARARRAQTRGAQASGGQAKYINTPETPIFTKGSILFGIDVARGAIREKSEAILVEGEFDVLSSVSAGVENVVASKGTALTDRQVAIVGRICENVVLCFDTDLAGDAAARRGIELLDLAGVNIRVATLGRYKDPDEFAQKDPIGFAKAIGEAGGVYDYLIDSAAKRHDPHDPVGKKKIGKEIMPTLARISDDLVRAHYIEKLARLLDLEATLVASAVEKKVEDLYVGDSNITGDSASSTGVTLDEYFLSLVIAQEELEPGFLDLLLSEDFEKDEAKLFWKWLHDIIGRSKTRSLAALFKKLPEKLARFIDDLYLINISPAFGEKEALTFEIVKISKRIKQKSIRGQLAQMSQLLKEAQKRSDKVEIATLIKKFNQLSTYLKEAI